MGYFNRDSNNRSGRDNRGGGRGFSSRGGSALGRGGHGDRPSFDREMFKTVCSNCGKDCEVPFRPTTGKPVYCSDCFEKMGGRSADSGSRPERPERNRSDFSERSQAPRVDNTKQLEELVTNLAVVNKKLDRVIDLLTPKTVEAPVVVKKVKKASLKVAKVDVDEKK